MRVVPIKRVYPLYNLPQRQLEHEAKVERIEKPEPSERVDIIV